MGCYFDINVSFERHEENVKVYLRISSLLNFKIGLFLIKTSSGYES